MNKFNKQEDIINYILQVADELKYTCSLKGKSLPNIKNDEPVYLKSIRSCMELLNIDADKAIDIHNYSTILNLNEKIEYYEEINNLGETNG